MSSQLPPKNRSIHIRPRAQCSGHDRGMCHSMYMCRSTRRQRNQYDNSDSAVHSPPTHRLCNFFDQTCLLQTDMFLPGMLYSCSRQAFQNRSGKLMGRKMYSLMRETRLCPSGKCPQGRRRMLCSHPCLHMYLPCNNYMELLSPMQLKRFLVDKVCS